MSIYELQQARLRAARWYGPWSEMLAAIRAARGASEGVVDAEPESQKGGSE